MLKKIISKLEQNPFWVFAGIICPLVFMLVHKNLGKEAPPPYVGIPVMVCLVLYYSFILKKFDHWHNDKK